MGSTDLFQHGLLGAYLWVFLGGFGTSLTPCVYPLIPITVSLFGARDENVSKGRAAMLAAAYVNGMGVMYATMGIVVGLAGKQFGAHLANPWFIIPLASFFLLMATSMFGAFELNLPPSLAGKLNKIGGKGFGGAFAMGLVGGIIAAPCTGPVLLSILSYIATTRSVVLGGTLLYVYALGMGILFFALAISAQKLPKSGAWMDVVKSIFGIVMVIAALYFLRNVFPVLNRVGSRDQKHLLVGAGLVGGGIAVGALHLSFKYSSLVEKLRKAFGVGLTILGGWMLCVAVLTPKETKLVWAGGDAGIEAAVHSGKPALFDFYADWCIPCKELDLKTFASPEVIEEMQRFALVKVDNTQGSDEDIDRQAKWDAKTLPTVVILDSHGQVVTRVRTVMEPGELVKLLQTIH